jgi:redox-sensing transcriptional repressor
VKHGAQVDAAEARIVRVHAPEVPEIAADFIDAVRRIAFHDDVNGARPVGRDEIAIGRLRDGADDQHGPHLVERRESEKGRDIRRPAHGRRLRGHCGRESGRQHDEARAHVSSLTRRFCYNPHTLVKSANKGAGRAAKAKQSLEQVSELTTNRLSVYLRCLNLLEGAGVRTISSQSLAEQFHLNAAQIRKDLAYFGEFGVRGVGYYVRDLKRHLRQILGLDRKVKVAIVGAGNLGLALADYPGFRQEGFEISALFDASSSKVGHQSRGGVPIHDINDLKKFVRRDGIRIGVIAVPTDAAQNVADLIVAVGIKAILNFSPGSLQVPADVKLKSVDLTVSLESLSFHLARGDGDGE